MKPCLVLQAVALSAALSAHAFTAKILPGQAPRMDRTKFQVGAWGFADHGDADVRVKEAADCGIDYMIGASVYDRKALDAFAKHGVGVVVTRKNLIRWWSKDCKKPSGDAELEAFAAELDHPAIWMLDACDEPNAKLFPELAAFVRKVSEKAPQTPAFVNLFPSYATVSENSGSDEKSQLGTETFRDYLEAYAHEVPLDHLSYDFYLYTPNKKRRPRLICQMYEGFEAAAVICRRTGRSFWYTPQVNSHPGANPEPTTENRLRFQAYSAMAYGAESVAWACWKHWWWTNNVLTAKGERTAQYERLKTVNAELHRLGPDYMRFRNVATHLVGFAGTEGLDALSIPLPAEVSVADVTGLKTREGTPLAVGEMIARKPSDGWQALFVLPSGDMFDSEPVVRTVTFRTKSGRGIRVLTGDGEVRVAIAADGTVAFPLAENAAALIVLERK